MRINYNRSWILIGVLLITTVAACQPMTEEEAIPDDDEPAALTPQATAVTQLATLTPTAAVTAVPQPPPNPTPLPTSIYADNWRRVGGAAAGMEIGMPAEWVNLSGTLDLPTATNPWGLSVLLLADSDRTGRSLLAGKSLREGAFSAGLVANQAVSASDPVRDLNQLISDQGTAVTPLNAAQSITTTASSGVISGAAIDITGDPLGFFSSGGDELRARLLLFPSKNSSQPDDPVAILFLLSAPAVQWNQFAATFEQMTQSIVIHDVQAGYALSGGAANVLGDLTTAYGVNGNLQSGARDIWTFLVEEARYATISLSPDDTDPNLDLAMTVINPSGQTISRSDSGYAGDTEIISDLLLTENGRYLIEVSEFFNGSGRYILSLSLDEEPRFSGAGKIRSGQGIQSELPVNAQHVWTFSGTAGQLVSIVLAPTDNKMDAILNLYGPDGQRLVALDEGFSGDPELISGFELAVSGTYSILVSSFGNNGGAYSLTLDEGGEAIENFYDAGDIGYGELKREALRRNEAQAWFFEGRAGDVVSIVVRPLHELLDLDVWLFDPEIKRLAAQDELAAGESESVELMLPRDGQYIILIRDFLGEAGGYEIGLSATPAAVPEFAGMLSYGKTITGTLSSGQTVFWRFAAEENEIIDIELTPGSPLVDVVFSLQDPDGKVVVEMDKGDAGQGETLQGYTLMADGLWAIVVKDFFGEGSTYALTVKRTSQ